RRGGRRRGCLGPPEPRRCGDVLALSNPTHDTCIVHFFGYSWQLLQYAPTDWEIMPCACNIPVGHHGQANLPTGYGSQRVPPRGVGSSRNPYPITAASFFCQSLSPPTAASGKIVRKGGGGVLIVVHAVVVGPLTPHP
ncbi:unnamed protein product, partial [Ectocarpus sp. 12 AP-2014]